MRITSLVWQGCIKANWNGKPKKKHEGDGAKMWCAVIKQGESESNKRSRSSHFSVVANHLIVRQGSGATSDVSQQVMRGECLTLPPQGTTFLTTRLSMQHQGCCRKWWVSGWECTDGGEDVRHKKQFPSVSKQRTNSSDLFHSMWFWMQTLRSSIAGRSHCPHR